jgi:vacuolar protein sorting-associated protein 13A/C
MEISINISIVPTMLNLPRIKLQGHVPRLHVNLSDEKYKSLMQIIDVAVPRFDQRLESKDSITNPTSLSSRNDQPLLHGNLFQEIDPEYALPEQSLTSTIVEQVQVACPIHRSASIKVMLP